MLVTYPVWFLDLYTPSAPNPYEDDWKTLSIFCKNKEPLLEVLDGLERYSPRVFNYDLVKVDGSEGAFYDF